MAITLNLKCGDCGHVFEWLFLAADRSDGPEECPGCRAKLDGERPPSKLPSAPHIENIALNRAADYAYRADENASQARAATAAESFGLDPGAAQSFVTTDFNHAGNVRPGDVVARTVQNDVSRMVQIAPAGLVGNVAAHTASAYAAASTTGPVPFAGLKSRSFTKAMHAQRGGITTDVPAVEIAMRDQLVQSASRVGRFVRR